jgi:hypothetical protein
MVVLARLDIEFLQQSLIKLIEAAINTSPQTSRAD